MTQNMNERYQQKLEKFRNWLLKREKINFRSEQTFTVNK